MFAIYDKWPSNMTVVPIFDIDEFKRLKRLRIAFNIWYCLIVFICSVSSQKHKVSHSISVSYKNKRKPSFLLHLTYRQ